MTNTAQNIPKISRPHGSQDRNKQIILGGRKFLFNRPSNQKSQEGNLHSSLQMISMQSFSQMTSISQWRKQLNVIHDGNPPIWWQSTKMNTNWTNHPQRYQPRLDFPYYWHTGQLSTISQGAAVQHPKRVRNVRLNPNSNTFPYWRNFLGWQGPFKA